MNIIYGANESGKSTVHAFIQSMLFGAERLRGRGAGRDAYSKYQPWEGGASYEGRMRLSYQDKNWRIVRNFYKDDSHFEVVDETSGRQEACASDDISSLIPGMQLSNYRNSISTGQLSVQPDGQFTTNMQSYMANMAMGATDSVDVGRALAYLKDERKKAVGRFSQETYHQYHDKAEMLRNELKAREGIAERQKALEQNRESILKQIQQLENDVKSILERFAWNITKSRFGVWISNNCMVFITSFFGRTMVVDFLGRVFFTLGMFVYLSQQ